MTCGPSLPADVLDITSAALGLVGSLLLLITAWRAIPFQAVIDEARGADPQKPGGRYVMVGKNLAERGLLNVHASERRYLIAGTLFLAAGFLCSIASHFF